MCALRRALACSPVSPVGRRRHRACRPRVLFVDGRYTVQAREEVDASAFAIAHLVEHPPAQWIEENLPPGANSLFALLHTLDGAERLAKAARGRSKLVASATIRSTPAGMTGRSRRPAGRAHDLRYAGESSEAKLTRVHAEIEKLKADALVVSIRKPSAGCSHPERYSQTPVALAFAVVPGTGRPRFISTAASSATMSALFEGLAEVARPEISSATSPPRTEKRAVRLDPAACPEAMRGWSRERRQVLRGADPIAPMKASRTR